jgi:hypothetical protein
MTQPLISDRRELRKVRANLGNFDMRTYGKLLAFLKGRYKVIPFAAFTKSDKSFLILRHDVDISLGAALEMARLERQRGIVATYFVHLWNRFYNLRGADDLQLLRRLSHMGHEVGLHYDIERYRVYQQHLSRSLLEEIRILEKLLGKRVRSIAMHNPDPLVRDPIGRIPGYINAYRFNREHDVFYVSDSCMSWRIADAHELVAGSPKRVQLLIHPIQWVMGAKNRYRLLDQWFDRVERENSQYRASWKKMWASLARVKEYDAEVRDHRRLLDFDGD